MSIAGNQNGLQDGCSSRFGMEWQGQRSELVRPKVDLEEYVEQRFLEEHTTHQMEEVW